tara:strand:+ start:10708 stop:11004 length:297 start_codon:yes stop_codon:yes gene_type:complete
LAEERNESALTRIRDELYLDRDLAVLAVKFHCPVLEGEESEIPTHSYGITGVVLRATLTKDDVAGYDGFTTKFLNPEALALAIATVPGSSLSFFVCHE